MERRPRKYWFETLIAAAIPLLTLLVFLISRAPPSAALFEGDPDFGYLFNSLRIAEGLTPAHIDHPGTPVQEAGALVMMLRNGGTSGLAEDFFLRPAAYHGSVLLTLLAVFLLLQWGAGVALLRQGAGWILTPTLQALPFLVGAMVPYLAHVSPEMWIAGFSLWLLPVLQAWLAGRDDRGTAAAAGILLGLLCSLKAVAFPLVFLLGLAPSLRAFRWSLGAAALAFLGFTAPIWSRYGDFALWLAQVSTHAGAYGVGPGRSLGESATRLAQEQDLLALLPALLLFAGLLLLPFRQHERKFRRFAPAAAAIGFVALELKQPGARYLLAFTPVLGIVLLRLLQWPLRAQALAAMLVLARAVSLIPHAAWVQSEWRKSNAELSESLQARLDGEFRDCSVTLLSPVPLAPYALYSGVLAASRDRYGPALDALFPRFTFWFLGCDAYSGELPESSFRARLNAYSCHVGIGQRDQAESAIRTKLQLEPRLLATPGPGYGIYGLP